MTLDDESLVQRYLVSVRYLWRRMAGVFQQLRLDSPTIVENEVDSELQGNTSRCTESIL